MFKLSKKNVYAIEAVVDIAYHAGHAPVQSQEITRRQYIPSRYLEQTLQQLVKSKILLGVRGPRGGYRLARERRRITVGEIIRTIQSMEEKNKSKDECNKSDLSKYVIHPYLNDLNADFMKRLDHTTIEDLCERAASADIKRNEESALDFII